MSEERKRPYYDPTLSAKRATAAAEFSHAVWKAMWKPAVVGIRATFGTFEIICNDGSKIKRGKK